MVATEMGRMWKETLDSEKRKYDEVAARLREEYNAAMLLYRKRRFREQEEWTGIANVAVKPQQQVKKKVKVEDWKPTIAAASPATLHAVLPVETGVRPTDAADAAVDIDDSGNGNEEMEDVVGDNAGEEEGEEDNSLGESSKAVSTPLPTPSGTPLSGSKK
jgi:hypothetical protein